MGLKQKKIFHIPFNVFISLCTTVTTMKNVDNCPIACSVHQSLENVRIWSNGSSWYSTLSLYVVWVSGPGPCLFSSLYLWSRLTHSVPLTTADTPQQPSITSGPLSEAYRGLEKGGVQYKVSFHDNPSLLATSPDLLANRSLLKANLILLPFPWSLI